MLHGKFTGKQKSLIFAVTKILINKAVFALGQVAAVILPIQFDFR